MRPLESDAAKYQIGLGQIISRGMLFAAVSGLAFLNAVSEKAYLAYNKDGLFHASLNTFDVSAIIWAGIVIAVRDLWSVDQGIAASARDKLVAGIALIMILIPVPALSSCAIALIGAYIWTTARNDIWTRSVGMLLFAVTVPLLWARGIFAAFSDTLLAFDARLIGLILGTEPYANTIPYADGSGGMFVGPACSSFTNISLAILCTAIFAHAFRRKWSHEIWFWAGVSSVAVLAINVIRISMIGLYPDQYDLIHGSVGATISGWITIGVILGISLHGVGRVRAA